MSPRLLLALTPVLALLSACAPERSQLDLQWTFEGGKSCADVGVSRIRVDIAGELLDPDTFSCSAGTGRITSGAHLGSFLVGPYDLTVDGLDASGNVTHSLQQRIQVKRGQVNTLDVDVPAVESDYGTVTLFWTFAGQSCAQAGVTTVRMKVDGYDLLDVNDNPNLPCSQNGTDGISIDPLTPGTHTFELRAYKGSQLGWSLTNLKLDAEAGKELQYDVDLQPTSPTSATALLSFSFAGMTCSEAQVDDVKVLVDGQDAGTVPCSSGGIDGAVVDGLSAGTHSFSVSAYRNGSPTLLVYRSPQDVTERFALGDAIALRTPGSPVGSGVGGARLTWKFPAGGPSCTGSTQTSITYSLTAPDGTQYPSQTATCGGGTTGVTFCNPGSTGCPSGEPGLAAGAWHISASTTGWAASARLPVPNAGTSDVDVAFSAR